MHLSVFLPSCFYFLYKFYLILYSPVLFHLFSMRDPIHSLFSFSYLTTFTLLSQSVIWPWILMYSLSHEKIETREDSSIDFLSKLSFPFLSQHCFFWQQLQQKERERKKGHWANHPVLWVMMSLTWSWTCFAALVSMFVVRFDNLISSFGCGAVALLNQGCQ